MSYNKIKIDVLSVGVSSYDLTFLVSHHPQPDEKIFSDSLTECGGGPAANAAVTVSKLGFKSAFAGYLGNDFYGEKHFEELKSAGVLTDFIVIGKEPTPISVSFVKPNGQRSLINYRKKTDCLKENSIDFSNIEPRVILLDGHEPEISLPLVKSASSRGIKTILDAGSVHRGTKALVDQVDYLICSEKFAKDFTGEVKEESAIEKLVKYSSNVLITLGERGLLWKNMFGEGRRTAFKVEACDTTGAGDAFHGAFAVCVACKKDWDKSLEYSSAVAAICCKKVGARTGIPYKEEVEKFIIKQCEAK